MLSFQPFTRALLFGVVDSPRLSFGKQILTVDGRITGKKSEIIYKLKLSLNNIKGKRRKTRLTPTIN